MLLPHPQAKQISDRLKRRCRGRDLAAAGACARLDKATKVGQDVKATHHLLAAAVASVVGKSGERAVASLSSSGGTEEG
ncbi:MAG: hypothetical protein IH608_06610 [Proteobacteria bacterium]|nr:hypothetical protein [Pseudomonadota bacterium]